MSADAGSAFRKKFSSHRLIRPKQNRAHPPALQGGPVSDEHVNSTTYSSDAASPTRTSFSLPALPSSTQQYPVATGEWLSVSADGADASWWGRMLERARIGEIINDQVTPLRLAGHLSVLLVAAIILFLSQYNFPALDISLRTIPNNALFNLAAGGGQDMQVTHAIAGLKGGVSIGEDSLQPAAVPFTISQERPREEISVYSVKSGDTVLGIAAKFGLQPETIQWANPSIEMNPDLLQIGDKLKILPVNGVLHTVMAGDTLASLAAKYKVDVKDIVGYAGNGLADENAPLAAGSEIVVPGGSKPYVARRVVAYNGPIPTGAAKGTGAFVWPTSGTITQQYWSGHRAIDIGSWIGSPIKASDSGFVIAAGGGWSSGYGNHVIIDHGNGFVTLYAHLNSIYVRTGESVSRGQQIGTVGSTGNSTGPHLHFEIRWHNVQRNPFGFLR